MSPEPNLQGMISIRLPRTQMKVASWTTSSLKIKVAAWFF